jgi:hypothetical protein
VFLADRAPTRAVATLPEHPLSRAALRPHPGPLVRHVEVGDVDGEDLPGAGGGLIQQPDLSGGVGDGSSASPGVDGRGILNADGHVPER